MKAKVEKFNGSSQYQSVGIASEIESATPHRLIQMLLDGAVSKISIAHGCIERQDIVGKCENIDWAMAIIGGLKSSLDLEKGGKIADNLDRLYDYMNRQLVLANARNDQSLLTEVLQLLNEIRAGWSGIADKAIVPSAAVGT